MAENLAEVFVALPLENLKRLRAGVAVAGAMKAVTHQSLLEPFVRSPCLFRKVPYRLPYTKPYLSEAFANSQGVPGTREAELNPYSERLRPLRRCGRFTVDALLVERFALPDRQRSTRKIKLLEEAA